MSKNLIPNSTQIPNIIIDFLLPEIPEGEARCLLYIARRTYGFHKTEDRISFSQFINGIKDRSGKILDSGCGLTRASVAEALKNLAAAGAILVRADSKGNFYKINLDMDVVAVVAKIKESRKVSSSGSKPVQEVNQFTSQTKVGSGSKPKVVQEVNTQKKGKQRKQSTTSQQPSAAEGEGPDPNKKSRYARYDDTTPFTLEEYVKSMRASPHRHIQILGEYAELRKLNFATKGQWRAFTDRNAQASRKLSPYSDEQIGSSFQRVQKFMKEKERKGESALWGIETIYKFLDQA